MRAVLLAFCVSLVALAAAAEPPRRQSLKSDPPMCHNLDMQMLHYQTLRARADAVNSDLWEQRLDAHLKNLQNQRKLAGCPSTASEAAAEAARQLKLLLELAAQGALTFFTMGAM